MIPALFWVKIAFKRIVFLLKSSPLMFIWVFVIIGAFIFAVSNRHLVIKPDIMTMLVIILFLFLCSIIGSFRNLNTRIELIRFSKSHYSNNRIYFKFFFKKAVKNNLLLIIFSMFSFNFFPEKFYFFIISGIAVLSVVLSFLIVYIKHKYFHLIKPKKESRRLKISPYIKSIFYDYLTVDFLAVFIICTGAVIVFIVEFIRRIDFFISPYNQFYVFIFMLVVFSIGFSAIIDSISRINWKYHAILSKNSLRYHYKRTLLFFVFMFGLLFIISIIIGCIINLFLLIKFIFCLLINMIISINIAFSAGNNLIKGILLMFLIAITIYISTLNESFLVVLSAPAAITFFKARNDIRERSLL